MAAPRVMGIVAGLVWSSLQLGCGGQTEYYAPEPDPYYQRVLERGRVEPRDDDERRLIAQIGEVEDGAAATVGHWSVTVGETYVAASGILCRRLTQQATDGDGAIQDRLTCTDQTEWFFVPDISGGSAVESRER